MKPVIADPFIHSSVYFSEGRGLFHVIISRKEHGPRDLILKIFWVDENMKKSIS